NEFLFFQYGSGPPSAHLVDSQQRGLVLHRGASFGYTPDVNDYQDDAEDYAAYFNPHFHWLGWTPVDPAWVAFGNHDVETTENWVDSPTSGSEADDPGLSLAGYFLEETWRSTAVKLERLACSTDWYGPNSLTPSLGHIPFGCHESHQVANPILRSQLGWLSWFTAVLFEWQRVFVNSLRLDERDRRGFLYNLTRDYHDSNFYFLMYHKKETGRFHITARRETSMSSLPSYSLWKDDLDRYDAFFQDTRFGKVGDVLTEFLHFGARVLDFRHERRGVRKTSHVGKRTVTTVTFLRHNPIRPNPHKFQLSDFGNENDLFRLDSFLARERARYRYAPRPDRSFNSYNGVANDKSTAVIHPVHSAPPSLVPGRGRPMSPTRRSGSTADQGFTSRWVSSMAAAGPREPRSLDGRRRASPPRSSPHRRRSLSSSTRSSYSSRSTASEKSSDHGYEPIDVDQTDHALLLSRDDAVREIRSWAISSQVSEFSTPGRGSADWYWKCALLRMKAWAACLAFTDIVEVLNFAICYGVPFHLGLQVDMSESEATALDAMYSPGFVESPLDYGSGGAPLYARYLSKVRELLRRPHATGYVAQVYDTLLVDRLRLGPSHQSEDKRDVRRRSGFISRNDPALDLFLWPLPTWIEEESLHYHGAWTRGFYAFLENLRSAIVEKKRYTWRTESQWR
ncbi:hypothetical protein K438DRAFT_1891877, partial [Mycena galopus ATCC 62051]